jgi:hypothetical protein
MNGLDVTFDADVRCARSADGSSMQFHGRSIDFFCQGTSLPTLPARLTQLRLREIDSPSLSRRFQLTSTETTLQFTVRAAQLHREVGAAMFAAIPAQPIPRWLRAAWWLLLSLLRVPGVGRLLSSSRGEA